jgi:hypothetical protein
MMIDTLGKDRNVHKQEVCLFLGNFLMEGCTFLMVVTIPDLYYKLTLANSSDSKEADIG